jgi:hypothetical protein
MKPDTPSRTTRNHPRLRIYFLSRGFSRSRRSGVRVTGYTRPHIEPVVFFDDAGDVVDYGNRWAAVGESPPEDSYSVVDHPERFAPLHAVAEALIAHLVSTYDVDVDEGPHVAPGLLHAPSGAEIVRAVRLMPRDDACAPLVVVLTSFPGVRVFAGVLFSDAFPVCGCNACDERWDAVAEELEWVTFAIVGGGFGEEVSEPRRAKWSYDRGRGFTKGMGQTVSYRLASLDGERSRSGQSRAEDVPAASLASAQARLEAGAESRADRNWLAWPLRRRTHASDE